MPLLEVLDGRRSWWVERCDVLDGLKAMPSGSVQCCVTSPPYFGLRDYGTATWEGGDPGCDHAAAKVKTRFDYVLAEKQTSNKGSDVPSYGRGCPCGARRVDSQIGLERTLDAYLARLVAVFREVRRALRRDGTCWVNMGDSYAGSQVARDEGSPNRVNRTTAPAKPLIAGYKPKDLMGVPWRLAFALQADGWYLRSDVIWSKANPMPESVTDRPTRSHEYLFLLTKAPTYYYDADAIREENTENTLARASSGPVHGVGSGPKAQAVRADCGPAVWVPAGRNRRSVWTIATQPRPEAHFAAFPDALVEPCVLAGTSAKGCCGACGAPWRRVVENTDPRHWTERRRTNEGSRAWSEGSGGGHGGSEFHRAVVEQRGWQPGCRCDAGAPVPCVVLDPFAGRGTSLIVALRHGRRAVGLELSPEYAALTRSQIVLDAPLFNTHPEEFDGAAG